MSDNAQLGISLQFDAASLKQLDQILSYVQKLQKRFDEMGNPIQKNQKTFQDINETVNRVNESSGKLLKTQTQINNTGSKITKTFKDIQGNFTKITSSYDTQNKIIGQTVSKTTQLKNSFNQIGTSIGNAVSKMALWSVSGALLFGTFRGIVSSMKTMADLETKAVDIAKVLPNNVKVGRFEESAIQLAKQYGQSVLDVEGSMQQWARQYKNVYDVSVMTRASLLAATATDISFGESVTTLSSIMAEWGMETKQSIHVVDVLNEMSNNYRTTAGDLASALTKTSAGAKAVGLSFEELSGILTTGIQVIGLSGDQIGTMWTRVMARIKGNKSAKEAFAGLGIDPNGTMSDMMNQLMVKWDQLTQTQKQNFAIVVAGTQHWSRFISIMDNSNTVLEATAKSYFSVNSAQQEVNRVMETLNKKVEQLGAAWEEYIHRNSGALGIQKAMVDSLRYIVQGLSQVPPALTLTVIGVTALTAAFFALRTAILASGAAALLNPWTAVIAGVALLAGILFTVGRNADGASGSMNRLQDSTMRLNQSIEATQNQVRGIDDLTKKYELLRKTNESLAAKGQINEKLMQKEKLITEQLISAIANGNLEYENKLRKESNLSQFANNRINELVKQINLERVLAYEQQRAGSRINTIGMTSTTSFAQTAEEVKRALSVYKELYQGRLDLSSGGLQKRKQFEFENADFIKVFQDMNFTQLTATYNELLMRNKSIDQILGKSNLNLLTASDITNMGMGEYGDSVNPEDSASKKIQRIIETLQNELIAINNQSQAYKQVGMEYDSITEKINAYSNALSAMSKIAPNNKNITLWATELTKLKPEQIFNELSVKMRVATDEFLASSNVTKYYTDKINALKAAISALSKIDPTNPKLKELQDQLSGIAQQSNLYQQWEDSVRQQAKSSREAAAAYEQYKMDRFNNVVDIAAEGLSKLGLTAAQSAATVAKAFYKLAATGNLTDEEIGGMAGGMVSIFGEMVGLSDKQTSYTAEGAKMGGQIAGGWGALIGGLIGFVAGHENYKPYESTNKYSLADTAVAANSRMDQFNQIKNYQEQIKQAQDKLKSGFLPEEFKNQGASYYWQGLKETINGLQQQIRAINDEIMRSLDVWVKAIGVSVEDIAGQLINAFQADNYMGFLQNWNQSLYSMTRDALIKSFMAQEVYQSLYKNLSEVIGLSVLDGSLSQEELTAIKNAGNDIVTKMKPIYQVLDLLKGNFPGVDSGGGSGSQTFQAGSSVPIVYNNYITIQSMAFAGNENEAREFALLMRDYIIAEEGRG